MLAPTTRYVTSMVPGLFLFSILRLKKKEKCGVYTHWSSGLAYRGNYRVHLTLITGQKNECPSLGEVDG